jgi:hypothetical protein
MRLLLVFTLLLACSGAVCGQQSTVETKAQRLYVPFRKVPSSYPETRMVLLARPAGSSLALNQMAVLRI